VLNCGPAGGLPNFSDLAEWHALYVRHQHERTVAHHLEQLEFQVFLPLYREIRRWSDRRKELSRPLFPGYVFFSGGLDRRLQILNTPGVCSLVMCAGKVAVIPAAELEPIGRIVSSNAAVAPHPFLRAGDRIRVRSGPLAGLEGLVARVKDARVKDARVKDARVKDARGKDARGTDSMGDPMRIVFSVQTLCQSIAVEVDESMVEPAARAA
jgi:transcription antitermination factor NusG